eukprot:350272-Chlamydomonas_euryale.AAC.11
MNRSGRNAKAQRAQGHSEQDGARAMPHCVGGEGLGATWLSVQCAAVMMCCMHARKVMACTQHAACTESDGMHTARCMHWQ